VVVNAVVTTVTKEVGGVMLVLEMVDEDNEGGAASKAVEPCGGPATRRIGAGVWC